jgi:hypothetical protein
MMRLTRDTVAALVTFVLSLCMLWLARDLPRSALVPIGPSFYPNIVLAVTAALSVLLIVVDALKARHGPAAAAAPQPPRIYRLVALTFIVFGAYVALLSFVGYRVATFLFVGVLQALLAPPRTAKAWAGVLANALFTSLLTFYIFEEQLQVLLPRGTWTGW